MVEFKDALSGKLTLSWRILYIFCACFQNMTMGGILYGWTSISSSLLVSSPSEGGPGLSRDYVNAMFVISSFFATLGPMVLGIVLDTYGPRVCSIVSILIVVVGSATFGSSNLETSPMFIPAMCLIAFGGPGVQSAIIHLSNLFPEWKASTTAIITGSFQLSFFMFYIFDQLWSTHGWDYQKLFFGYGLLCLFHIVISLLFWPDKPYSYDDQREKLSTTSPSAPLKSSVGLIRLPSVFVSKSSTTGVPITTNTDDSRIMNSDFKDPDSMTLFEQLTSSIYVNLTLFFVMASFWANFFIATIDLRLGDEHSLDASAITAYGKMFTVVMTLGTVAIPFVGACMDTLGFPATSFFTSLFGLVWSVLLMSSSRSAFFISFVLYTLFRTFLFTFMFAYLADTLGFKYFGVLAGVLFAISGFVGLGQYYLAQWATGTCHSLVTDDLHCDRGQWSTINLCMLATFVCMFAFSYSDWVRRKNRQRALKPSMSVEYMPVVQDSPRADSALLSIRVQKGPRKEAYGSLSTGATFDL